MNIQHLRYAIEVAKTGSITKAAENLFMGQPNLSKAIRELETSLNIRLFRRSSRGVLPTAEGEEFLQYARGIIAQVDKVESLYRPDRSSQLRFNLCSMPSMYTSELFSRFCARVSEIYPDAQLRLALKELPRHAVFDSVADGTCDAGLLHCKLDEESTLVKHFNRKDLDYKVMAFYQYGVLMSKRHPLANTQNITRDLLAPYPRITLESSQEESPCLFESELTSPVAPGSIIVSGRDSVLLLLQRMRDAYITTSPLPATLLDHYQLVIRPASGDIIKYRYIMIARRGGLNGRLENILLDEINNMNR